MTMVCPSLRRVSPYVRASLFGGLVPGLALASGNAQAHSFVAPYSLPVPFEMYAFGATTALVLSFLLIALGATSTATQRSSSPTSIPIDARHGVRPSGLVGLFLLVLTILTGLLGNQNPWANWNMTFFWIVFVLGVAYAVAVFGDFYGKFNPWVALVDLVGWTRLLTFEGRIKDPARFGLFPALLVYVCFIWFELFSDAGPSGLSHALASYTAINVAGAWIFGRSSWFAQGELFAVLMHLLGRLSLLPGGRVRNEPSPDVGGQTHSATGKPAHSKAASISLVLFVLFMLSSTAFDGLHSTTPWNHFFWATVYPVLESVFPTTAQNRFPLSVRFYNAWQWTSLLSVLAGYFAVYSLFSKAMKLIVGSRESLFALMARFALTLVPIALVYHVTHYFTLLLSQGPQIIKLASDPFGLRWNLFGTANANAAPIFIDASVIWHTQVALILVGHVASVYLAHLEALRSFGTPRRAAISQIPMLGLMMAFTTFGLYILSLPLGSR